MSPSETVPAHAGAQPVDPSNQTTPDAEFYSISRIHNSVTAWCILGISLIVTAVAWYLSHRYIEHRARDRFEFHTQEIRDAVERRMLEYEQVLRSGVGLYASSKDVSREEWRAFIGNSELQQYYPGIQGIGFAAFVRDADKQDYVRQVRAEGFPDFEIKPPGQRPVYGVVHHLEPFDWRNQRAFGYDMYSDPVRRAAMNEAIATGQPAISGLVTLVQETQTDVQPGFLVYLPLFDRSAPQETLAEQAEAVKGFVYAPFRARDLFEGTLGSPTAGIDFEVYDGEVLTANHLLYDSSSRLSTTATNASSRFVRTLELDLRGRTWTLFFESQPGFIGPTELSLSFLVACVGLIVDVLLFLVIGSIGRQHRHATSLANAMTQAYRRQEQQFKAVCDSAHDPIVLSDGQGNLIYANPAAERSFGYASDELLGHPYRFLIGGAQNADEQSCLEASSDALLSSERSISHERHCRRKNGEEFPAEVSTSHWIEGDQAFMAIVVRDISERKEKEALIRQTVSELRRSNRDLDDFANIASHDLRSPLRGIAHLADWTLEDAGDSLPASCREHLQKLQDRIRLMDRLLRDLLAYSRAGKVNDRLDQVDTGELTTQVVSLLDRPAEFTIEIADDMPTFETLRTPLETCLRNLIANAIKHHHASTGHVTVSATVDERFVHFRVADDGPGIDPAFHDRIFKIFHTLAAKSSGGTGSGVGLAIIKKTVETYGGSIEVESTPGQGTCFVLHWPRLIVGRALNDHRELVSSPT